ncbi:hypothetical protein [Streptomyces sp. NPDC047070]|uniref:hypothetical protein n=1 Tax=Streptomyces sp. NPDC047070 TaxID=3154923 RepID=UPI00345655AC
MSIQAPKTLQDVRTFTFKALSGQRLLLTDQETQTLIPALRETLTDLPKEDDNADLCQDVTLLLRLSNRIHGTDPGNRATCICNG